MWQIRSYARRMLVCEEQKEETRHQCPELNLDKGKTKKSAFVTPTCRGSRLAEWAIYKLYVFFVYIYLFLTIKWCYKHLSHVQYGVGELSISDGLKHLNMKSFVSLDTT